MTPKKSKLSEAGDALKNVTGEVLGAAAVAATDVIIAKAVGTLKNTGKQLEEKSPDLQRIAGETVAEPLVPKRRRHGIRKARGTKAKTARRKPASKQRIRTAGTTKSKTAARKPVAKRRRLKR